MVYLISNNNRTIFSRELDSMHRDRKRVFVDWLKWDVPIVDDIYEIDQYDTDDAVYIVSADPETGRHYGSLRLIPSTKPHMLQEVFPMLCEDGVPVGDTIWEMTRLCLSPDLPHDDARQHLGLVWLATIEFCLPRGITAITALTHTMLISSMLASGIDLEPLGPPEDFGGKQFGAILMPISQALYTRTQQRRGLHTSILHDCRPAAAA